MLVSILAACTTPLASPVSPPLAALSHISQAEYPALDPRLLGAPESDNFQPLASDLGVGAAIALALILILLVFSWMLRNHIRQRTQELEKTLEALHESRRFLADLIEYSGALVFVKDLEGRYELINRKWEEVTGLKRAEVIGKTDEVLFPGSIGEQFRANDLEVIKSGAVLEREELLEDAWGQRFFISIKFPLWDEAGRVKGTCGMTTEITERKQAEKALRQSEDKFSQAFHTSPDSVNINRLQDGLFLDINQGFTALTGYTRAEVQGKTSLDINIWANPEDRARLVKGLQEHGEVLNLEAPFRMKDGVVKTGLMSARTIEVGGEKCILSITREITERKRAEEALRESEERFRAIIEQASEGFALVDEQGLLIEWNRGQERIMGLTREEVLGRPVYDIQFQILMPSQRTPERYASLKAMALEALRTGQSPLFDRVVEAEFHRPDGQRAFVQQSIFPIKTGQGYRLGGISLDITERKQTEAALQASEQRMRAIVEAAPYGAHFYELEPNGRLVFKGFNPSADQILHVDHRQFVGKTIEEAFPPLVETEIPAAYRHVAAAGERYQLDHIAYDDARIRGAYELHAFQTGPNQMAVFFRDITERKQMEEALRISLEKYRVLFESFPLGVSITDSTGKILETNLQAEKLLGVSKQEHERRTYDAPEWNMIRSDGTPMPVEEYAATRAMRENRLVQNIEMGVMREQGDIIWLSVTAAPIPLKGYGVAIAYGDITRHKEIEDEIRRLNDDLELRVIDRTRELAAANARLTELDQLKSKFVSDVSHELRTPIANLKLYIDLLEHGKPEKHSHYLTVLRQQIRRVTALVDDILDLSRLERRKEQGIRYQAVRLNEVVDQVVQAHQPRAEAAGLTLTFAPAPDLPPVYGDANQLAQVVTNLVANALSYTAAGDVRVSTYSQDNRVCLRVEDSGSGIPAQDLPHIFERFYRGHLVLQNDIPGTGLGLAIVKEIVDLHQGQIEVDSHLGQGTTFQAWLPAAMIS